MHGVERQLEYNIRFAPQPVLRGQQGSLSSVFINHGSSAIDLSVTYTTSGKILFSGGSMIRQVNEHIECGRPGQQRSEAASADMSIYPPDQELLEVVFRIARNTLARTTGRSRGIMVPAPDRFKANCWIDIH